MDNTNYYFQGIDWEIKARKYCELAGLDPDERVGHGADPNPDGTVYLIALKSPRWKRCVRLLQDHWLAAETLKE